MNVSISPDWKELLQDEFEKEYFNNLVAFVKNEYAQHKVYPSGKSIFSVFDHCSLDDLKVVIMGQDPYHGIGQANGLCFSVNDGITKPPSLLNIFKEIKTDIGTDMPESGNLERWAGQGVFLLNATLTVRAQAPGSHQNKGWEEFTDAVIQKISRVKKNIVFLLWGAYAQKKGEIIDAQDHLVLRSSHPSPFAAHRGFLGNKHFSKTNEYLKSKNLPQIVW